MDAFRGSKNMKSREIMKILKDNGWYIRRITGSHYHFKHEMITGLVTVPHHATEELKPSTLHNIVKMACLTENDFLPKKSRKSIFYKSLGEINAITNSY
jgi:predicted RNA binding protein YcfA (HicA-like mRNA interferase family)